LNQAHTPFSINLMQVQKFKVFHPESFSTMVLFLIVDVSFGSFQLGPPDANPDYSPTNFLVNNPA